MKPRVYIVHREASHVENRWAVGGKRKLTYGVYIDLDALEFLAEKAAKNKGRKSHDGALSVEIHSIEPLDDRFRHLEAQG